MIPEAVRWARLVQTGTAALRLESWTVQTGARDSEDVEGAMPQL